MLLTGINETLIQLNAKEDRLAAERSEKIKKSVEPLLHSQNISLLIPIWGISGRKNFKKAK